MASPAPTPEDLALGLHLFVPYRAMENRIFEALARAGFDDFALAQARIMQRIGPDGTRLTELAESAQVTKQTASHLVDQLERTGYVRRTPDPSDARARLVRLAERGAAAQPVAAAALAQVAGRVAHPPGWAPVAAAPRDPREPARDHRPATAEPGSPQPTGVVGQPHGDAAGVEPLHQRDGDPPAGPPRLPGLAER